MEIKNFTITPLSGVMTHFGNVNLDMKFPSHYRHRQMSGRQRVALNHNICIML